MKKLLIVAFTATLLGLTSCEKMDYLIKDSKNTKDCTEEVKPGVILRLKTSDGKPLFFVEGKLVNIKTGEVEYLKADEKQCLEPIHALYGKAGVYDIYLYAKGYEPLVLKEVVVNKNECNVISADVIAYFFRIIGDQNTNNNNNQQDSSVVCTTEARPGVVLHLMNKDGKPLQTFVEGKILNLKTNEVEYLKIDEKQSTQPVSALFEKAGVFDIYLYAKGYEPVVLKNIEVNKDICHVKTVELKALFGAVIGINTTKETQTTDVYVK